VTYLEGETYNGYLGYKNNEVKPKLRDPSGRQPVKLESGSDPVENALKLKHFGPHPD
jgi:hypothetical protein